MIGRRSSFAKIDLLLSVMQRRHINNNPSSSSVSCSEWNAPTYQLKGTEFQGHHLLSPDFESLNLKKVCTLVKDTQQRRKAIGPKAIEMILYVFYRHRFVHRHMTDSGSRCRSVNQQRCAQHPCLRRSSLSHPERIDASDP